MSCFVVDKASFAKAAGIVAGIADTANAHGADRFWIFDTVHGRNMAGTDYLEKFYLVYKMNLKSVSESWRENLPEDTNEYTEEFQTGRKLGKMAYYTRWENGGYLRMIQELRFFFDGIRYQIDNPELERKAAGFLNAVTVKLMAQIDPDGDDHDSWGSLDLATFANMLTESKEKVTTAVHRALGF